MKFVAFYLPQFHEIDENNRFWGKGFTEWTNVKKCQTLFYGHRQPKAPTILGYYDLLDENTIKTQMQLASKYGIDVFAVYIYWFNGKSIMEKPLKLLFKYAAEFNIEIFFVWANENWTRKWDGEEKEILLRQEHNLNKDLEIVDHYSEYFQDASYFKIKDKLMFAIYRPDIIPDCNNFLDNLRLKFKKCNFEVHLSMIQSFMNYDPRIHKLDSAIQFPPHQMNLKSGKKIKCNNGEELITYSYKEMIINANQNLNINFINFPGVLSGWDNTPRRGKDGHLVLGSEAVHFYFWIMKSIHYVTTNLKQDFRLIFINAWNEWAEGAFLEPDYDSGFSKLWSIKFAKSQIENQGFEKMNLAKSRIQEINYSFDDSFKLGEYI